MSTATNGAPAFSVRSVANKAPKLPNRIILHGVSGWGKTSFAAQIPGAVFLLVGQETGLWTLMESGEVNPAIPHFPAAAQSMGHLFQALQSLLEEQHEHKVLVIDAITSIDAMLQQNVCNTNFHGNWTEFHAFGGDQASKLTAIEWEPVVRKLEEIRNRGIGIMLISHSRVVNFKNPEGPDYERWESLTKHPWLRLTMWADMVLFGAYEQAVVKKDKKKSDAESKGKAVGEHRRVLYTERHGAYDAKHRHGLPPEIDCGHSPAEAWANFRAAQVAAQKRNTQPPTN